MLQSIWNSTCTHTYTHTHTLTHLQAWHWDGCLLQPLGHCCGCPLPNREYPNYTPVLPHSWGLCLFRRTPGGSRCGLKDLGPWCHPGPGLAVTGIGKVKQQMPRSLAHLLCLSNKQTGISNTHTGSRQQLPTPVSHTLSFRNVNETERRQKHFYLSQHETDMTSY